VLRRGRYGQRAAGRDLERLSAEERAGAEAWYRLTEERALILGAPSNLGWLFVLRCISFVLEMPPGSPNSAPGALAVDMGYAARMVDAERRSDLRPWSETDIADLVDGDDQGRIDLDAIKDQGPRRENLFRWVTSRTDDPEVFFTIASCTPSLWDGLTSWAVLRIHDNMRRRSARPRDLPPSTLDGLMRLGYVLRCLDEALGEDPR